MFARDTERFLGRADALAELEDAYSSAVRGHPVLVLVTGDAGIGKSTLVARFAASKPGARVLRGGCFGLVSAELPYGPVVQALRPLGTEGAIDGQISSVDGATLCSALGGSATAVGEATRWAQSRLFESTLRLFADLSRERPLVVCLEDLHWVDQATLDLLLFVLGNLVNERILFLLTSRADEPEAPPWLEEGLQRLTRTDRASILELGPLPPEQCRELAAAVAGDEADAAVVRALVDRAEGNPLFLTELARARAGTDSALPRRLRDLLLLRLTRLSADGRRVVEALSVATTPLDPDHVVAALEDDVADPRSAVAEAFEARLVTTDGDDRLVLRHALLADAVYAELPPTERQHRHAALATAVEADDDSGALTAYHWERAGRPDRVVAPLTKAARAAARCFAFADAARAWERLLDLQRRLPGALAGEGLDRAQVLVELARVQRWGPEPERAVASLREAIDLLAGERHRAAAATELLARQLRDLGRVDDALDAVADATRRAGGAPGALRAGIEATHASVLMIQGDFERSRQRCEVALALAGEEEDALWERAHALAVLGAALVNLGDVTGSVEALESASAVALRLDDPEPVLRIFVNQAYVLEAVGRYRDAVRVADDGLRYAEQHDMDVVAGTLLLGNKASALIATGDLAEARASLVAAVERPGLRSSVLYARLRLAEVEVALGAREAAEEILAGIGPHDLGSDSVIETQYRLVRALLALAHARPDEALEQARSELARGRGGTEPVAGLHLYAVGMRALSLAAARSGTSPDDLVEDAAGLMKAAGTLRDQAPLPPCQDLHDLCGLEYQDCLGRVEPEAWEALAARLEDGRAGLAAYAHVRAAEARLAADGRRAAEAELQAAWRLLRPLGDTPLGQQVRSLAASCRLHLEDVPAPAGTPAAPSPFGLTPRETEVLRLVCDGATNRQIARALGISERTAGVHVSNILPKLRARNRAEAIAVAHRGGLVSAP